MAAPRRKWRVEPDRGWPAYSFPSENKAYEYVRELRARTAEIPAAWPGLRRIVIWVDERHGAGWERFEVLVRSDDGATWTEG